MRPPRAAVFELSRPAATKCPFFLIFRRISNGFLAVEEMTTPAVDGMEDSEQFDTQLRAIRATDGTHARRRGGRERQNVHSIRTKVAHCTVRRASPSGCEPHVTERRVVLQTKR